MKLDFLIIGVQKGGTTSLYHYLSQHPQIIPASQKEVHFFDLNFSKGLEWYQSQLNQTGEQSNFLFGEASPYYIFHPLVPQRVYQLFPQVKLILLLRNPVARTLSHYYHEVRLGWEKLSLTDAIAQEPERLAQEREKILTNPDYYSFNHQHYSYLSRSRYIEQIQHWRSDFPPEQFLLIKSEELDQQRDSILSQVWQFLEIPELKITQSDRYNVGEYPLIPASIKQQLTEYFQPYNRQLAEYLERDFGW